MADAQIDARECEVELRALVGHAHSVAATATVETTLAAFARHGIDFIAVQEAGRLLGVALRPIACTEDQAGPALGMIDDFEFSRSEEPLAAGDRFLLFTDGLTEAATVAGEEFGEPRVAAVLARGASQSLDGWLDGLLAEVKEFSGPQFADDVCLVAIEIAKADSARGSAGRASGPRPA